MCPVTDEIVQYHLACYTGDVCMYIYLLFKPRGNPYAPCGHIKYASTQPDLNTFVRLGGVIKRGT